MSDGTADLDARINGWGGGPETAGRGDAAVSADAIGECRRTDPAGVDVRTARHSASLFQDSPNIVIVLIDDAGPGLPTTFGGEVRTATMDRICAEGVSYNRFHTTAMCSPTRASLLTGRNHHEIGNGQIAELANDWDGYAGKIPRSSALVAEVLKDYGYSTGAWGKWHNTPAEDTTAAGPFEDWPTGLGFEYFYGFLAGRPRSTSRTWCATPLSWRRRRRPRRAITSRRTWPTTRSTGCATTRRCRPIDRFLCIGPAGVCMARTTS